MVKAAKPSFTRRILLFAVLGLVVLVFYLYYFVGTTNIIDEIEHTNLALYISSFIAFILSILFYSLTWQSLLSNLNFKTKIRKVLLLTWAGLFFDATVPEPGWTGELSKVYLLAKSSNEDAGRIAASVIGQKIIVMAITVFDLILGLALLAWSYVLPVDVLIFVSLVLILTIFSSVVVLYVSTKPTTTERMLNWLIRAISFVRRGHWDFASFRTQATDVLKKFHEGIRTLGANPKDLVRPVLLALVSWGFDVSIVFLVFASLGYPVPADKVLIVYALTGSLQSIGVSFVGFTEIIMSSSYTVLGIPIALSLSATLLTRIVTLWLKMILSYFAFQYAGLQILTQPTTKNPTTQPTP